ncbi:tyrosine recombinase XerS [Mesobacillus subterraneus]|uniref:tyrosine recombinase XerS n=1 Tax=Mesobacillus subterraneus TaxID=285983 RepID=UPI0020412504|nr:tyrosine recombinase XerS [Mesobacillus subterraneus]MCM3576061.1 tyrosine recombinase XerS [Mesobacillus subterraneus]
MKNNSQSQNYKKLDSLLKELPWFVEEYIDKKKRKLSPGTLLNYCHDFKIFFNWLVSEGFYNGEIKEIPLSLFETLTTQQIEDFLSFLKFQLDNREITINRKLSSLKSLFNYLQNVAETEKLEPYLTRNVMAKIEFNDVSEDPETIANRMEGKILIGDEYEDFRLFVAKDYGETNKSNKRITTFFNLNKERDTAIVSLFLGSGLRLSELVWLNIEDIDFNKNCVRVIRKGNKEQYVYFSEQAMADLKAYLSVRGNKYNIPRENKAVFVAAPMGPKGTTRRLSGRAIEKLIEKYAIAFGKPSLSVHKLRHSFATRYHSEINDVPKLRRQLGHSSIETTMIYTHLKNEDLKNAINKLNMPKEQ